VPSFCLAALVGALASTCSSGSDAPSARSLHVEWTGCETLLKEGVCVLADTAMLEVWVPNPWAASATFESARGTLASSGRKRVEAGTRFQVEVPADARSLRLKSVHGGASAQAQLVIQHVPMHRMLREAEAKRERGELVAAAQLLMKARNELSGLDRLRALAGLARLELSRGEADAAVKTFREALALSRKLGAASYEVRDATALSFLLTTRLHRFDEAQAELDLMRLTSTRIPEGAALHSYFEALIDFELGDLRRALAGFRRSLNAAERLGMTRHARTARDRIAAVLTALGRSDEAIATLSELLDAPSDNGCDEADVLINLGWFQLDRPEVTSTQASAAVQLSRRALLLFPQRCADPFRRAIAETNLAFAFVTQANAALARTHLAAAREAGVADRSLSGWWLLLEGQLARLDNQLQAAAEHFTAAAELADVEGLAEIALPALLALGDVEQARGAFVRALDAYAQSEALLDRRVLDVPLGDGRAAFLARHDQSAKAAIQLLLARGSSDRAFEVARNARARAQRALEDGLRAATSDAARRSAFRATMARYRQDRDALRLRAQAERELPVDALALARKERASAELALLSELERNLATTSVPPSPALPRKPLPGLTLLFHPLRQGYAAFARDAQGLATQLAQALPQGSEEARAEQLLTAFDDQLTRAQRVSVLVHGTFERVDFHALSFHGAPLIEHVQVSYPLDLHTPASSAASNGRALVVADPTLDLPRARREADVAAHALREAGLSVTLLTGNAATGDAVSRALEQAMHVHFAGHASSAGDDGWHSHLSLAGGETLSMADVFSSPMTARCVVLSSCQAAKSSAEGLSTLSVGAAFALAGAQAVVAPTRVISDDGAEALLSAVYQHAHGIVNVDWAEALRAAQREMRQRDPTADWAAFRVVTP
jgi:tetratricopeptide (TPR) repeat protein